MFLDEKVKKCADLQPGFNQTAEALPKTDFVDYLLEKFGDKATASAVLDAFEKMGIPAPESRDEFMDGAAGVLVFLNRYGLVIRIEHEYLGRINDSPWVLKPIASIDADEAIFEICPGCLPETDKEKNEFLIKQFKEQNIFFWDKGIRNIGRVPFKTSMFLHGIPVVFDRPSVIRLTDGVDSVRSLLGIPKSREFLEAEMAQEKLYGPLRDAFDAAWPDKLKLLDPSKMKRFWNLCECYKKEGKLAAGWNNSQPYTDGKADMASMTARFYETRLESPEQTITPVAAAVHQSLCQPV